MSKDNKTIDELSTFAEERKKEMLEEHKKLKKIYEKAYHDYQLLVLSVFNNENGRKLLEAWERYYFYRPIFPSKDDKDFTEFEPQHREGENRFIRKLLTDFKQAEKQKG